GHGRDRIIVAHKPPQLLPRGSVPEAHGLVRAASEGELTVRGNGKARAEIHVGSQPLELSPANRVPKSHRTILATGENVPASGCERHGRDRALVRGIEFGFLSGGEIQPGESRSRVAEQALAVRRKRDSL